MVFEKTCASSDLLFELEMDKEYQYLKDDIKKNRVNYYETYFPYDDLKILSDFAKGAGIDFMFFNLFGKIHNKTT